MKRRAGWGLVLVTVGASAAVVACSSDDPSGGTAGPDAGSFDGSQLPPQPTPAIDAPVDAGTDATADADIDAAPTFGALRFDGLNDQVVMTMADGGPSETAFTAEVWFKTTTTLGNMFQIFGTAGGADRFLYTQDGKVCFYVYGPATTTCTDDAGYNDGNWHHAAGTLGAANGQRVYVDGVLKKTLATTIKSTFTGGNRVSIGYGNYGFVSALVYFAGDLDEVRLWSVERSEAEIAASWRQVLPSSTPSLQGYWRFQERGDAGTVRDEASDPHEGVLGPGFVFTPSSPWVGPGPL